MVGEKGPDNSALVSTSLPLLLSLPGCLWRGEAIQLRDEDVIESTCDFYTCYLTILVSPRVRSRSDTFIYSLDSQVIVKHSIFAPQSTSSERKLWVSFDSAVQHFIASPNTDVIDFSCMRNTPPHLFLYSYSVQSSAIVSGAKCQGTPEGEISFISCRLNELIYLLSQSAAETRPETRVPPDAGSWSRFRKTEKRALIWSL